jgi:hypothetical protein
MQATYVDKVIYAEGRVLRFEEWELGANDAFADPDASESRNGLLNTFQYGMEK